MAHHEKGGHVLSIETSDLSFSYGTQAVLKHITFTARDGELLSVLGPNGVGKSTLFRCILGLLRGYTGRISVGGKDIRSLSASQMARLVAYIPQSHYPSFNFSVYNMVLMGTTGQFSALSGPGPKQKAQAAAALEKMGLAHLAEKDYTHISGGEQQLVLIARALVQNAQVLVLDEPTANLDYGNQLLVMRQIRALTADGYAVIQSTHNPEQAFLFSDHILAMKDGAVLADGAPSEIVTSDRMRALYGADIDVCSLYDDRLRVCVPKGIIQGK